MSATDEAGPELLPDDTDDLDLHVTEATQAWVDDLVARVVIFAEELADHQLYPYQRRLAARIVESVVLGDGEEITALQARQSGKTEALATILAALMLLLPRLAKVYPEQLGKFKKGFWVGVFAPTDEQVETAYGRIVDRLTSDRAVEIMRDPEIDEVPQAKGKLLKLSRCGSFVRMQTAHPRAKVESKSYHFVLIDEAQEVEDMMMSKSIFPMLAAYNGSRCLTGTPTTKKGYFYKAIQHNKRRQTRRGSRPNHFQADWRECGKHRPDYKAFVLKERVRLGEDSDEFQLAYMLRWLLSRGMFVSSEILDPDSPDFIGDKSMEIEKSYFGSPLVAGLDVARNHDSTVLTVVWVDWNNPDPFGMMDHRILNWLEIHGERWEEQYYQIVTFLRNYDIAALGVDSNGMGSAVAERLEILLPRVNVQAVGSSRPEQSKRWTYLQQLLGRPGRTAPRKVTFPAHAKTRRLRTYRRFVQQLEDLEKEYAGGHLMAQAPDEPDAHDDYADSLAIACSMTEFAALPEVEVYNSPFVAHRRRN